MGAAVVKTNTPIMSALHAPLHPGEMGAAPRRVPGEGGRVALDDGDPEKGLAKLALTLIDLLRRLCEKQALRRIEGGSLSEDEIERLGTAFLRLERKMAELKETFGLENEDLNLDLGPLGDLM
jgi:hypothetical protein